MEQKRPIQPQPRGNLMGMKLTEAIKKYFSRYDDEDEAPAAKKTALTQEQSENLKKVYKKKKKKKGTKAGSYFKKKREGYEKALQEADEY
jgi:hypothetical protein